MKKIFKIWRPFLYLIIINITIIVLSNVYFYRAFNAFYLEQSIKELAIRARLFGWEVRNIPLVTPNKPLIDHMAQEFGEISESRVTIINRLGHVSGDSSDLPEWAINYPPQKELNVWKEGDMLVDIRDSDVTGEKPCLWPRRFTLTANSWVSVVRPATSAILRPSAPS